MSGAPLGRYGCHRRRVTNGRDNMKVGISYNRRSRFIPKIPSIVLDQVADRQDSVITQFGAYDAARSEDNIEGTKPMEITLFVCNAY